jgi:hypothetical protein
MTRITRIEADSNNLQLSVNFIHRIVKFEEMISMATCNIKMVYNQFLILYNWLNHESKR